MKLTSLKHFSVLSPLKRLFKMGNSNSNAGPIPESFYSIVEKDAQGNDVSFEKYKGKVIYGVNVASRCGYTESGYNLISRIAALKEEGVEVLLFPCNQVSI